MSRIGNKYMTSFVATQEPQGEYMKQLLEFSGECACMDTCCGEGFILKQLTEGAEGVVTYGVEIEKRRAETASTVLDKVIEAPIESMIISNDSCSLNFLNPPYDYSMKSSDDEAERKEYTELIRTYRYLMPGGVLIYVIPAYRYSDKKIARFLATNFNEMSVARFTDENFDEYKQVVFIGKKKRGAHKEFSQQIYDIFMEFADEEFVRTKLPDLKQLAEKKKYTVPTGKPLVSTFYSRLENKSVFVDAIKENKGFKSFIERTKPKTIELKMPVINLAQGQLALLLASGSINGELGNSPKTIHIVRGMENISKVISTEETEYTTITKARTKREISVKVITPGGVVKKLM